MTEAVARQDGDGEFWEAEPGWVLLDSGDGTYLPFNQITSMVMLVCDDVPGDIPTLASRALDRIVGNHSEWRDLVATLHGAAPERQSVDR